MLYRVDLLVLALAAGLAAGLVVRRRAPGLARGYLAATLAVLGVLVATQVSNTVLGPEPAVAIVAGVTGALASALAGAALVLPAAHTAEALRIATGVGFVLSAIGKAFAIDFMVGFFARSGYSIAFLRWIMLAEVLGGLALILPWRRLALAAVAGLAINMLGAIATHARNGDPLDDSTAAFAMLVRLGLIAWQLGVGPRRLAIAAVVGLALALAGAAAVRAPVAPGVAPAAGHLVGAWHCAGTFASGRAIEADLHVDADPVGWLIVRHDDRPPNRYHALAQWRVAAPPFVATIVDGSGGLRVFRSPGWQGNALVWDGGAIGAEPAERFVYEDRGPVALGVRYEVRRAEGWKVVDTLACTRSR